MRAHHKKRLLKLADLLMKDARNKKGIKFDMRTWGVVKDPETPMSCGTSACAMGLAALSGAFSKAGLRYRISSMFGLQIFVGDNDILGDAIRSAEIVFGLTNHQAVRLFMPDGRGAGPNVTGAAAEIKKAKQIRHFVKTGEIKPISKFK